MAATKKILKNALCLGLCPVIVFALVLGAGAPACFGKVVEQNRSAAQPDPVDIAKAEAAAPDLALQRAAGIKDFKPTEGHWQIVILVLTGAAILILTQ
ncbi:MAG: hypothetical protein QMD09_05795 [Desulfatibacillaceae bacterium]|nr:hypothetical protein [Desulfatibacillaceae bacterium]